MYTHLHVLMIALALCASACTLPADDAGEIPVDEQLDGYLLISEPAAHLDDSEPDPGEADRNVIAQELSCEEHYAKCVSESRLGSEYDAPNKTRCHFCLDRCQKEGEWPYYTYSGRDCRYALYPIHAIDLEISP